MKLPTVHAVRCTVCGKLHGVNDHDYFVLWGKLIVNTNANEPMNLGTDAKPTILCQDTTCLQRLFRMIDDETYKAMLTQKKVDYDDEYYNED